MEKNRAKKFEWKTFPLEVKEFSENGILTGFLSTFGNIDKVSDIVEPGAFKKSLREKKVFPLAWHHDLSTPDLVVGTWTGEEEEKGLNINAEFFGDDESQKVRKKTKNLVDRGVHVGLSMGFLPITEKYDMIGNQSVRRLKEVALHEGSITLLPANDLALVGDVKAMTEEEVFYEYEMKPYPNEHACRLQDPDKYVRFKRMARKHDGKTYYVIIGWTKDGKSEDQTFRYPKDKWSESEARAHCKEHDGFFEPAKKSILIHCSACEETLEIGLPAEATTLNEPSKPDEPGMSLLKAIQEDMKIFRR